MTDTSEEALLALFARHRNELRLHCYRMLGSSHDSEDMLQETVTRAWRFRDGLHDPARARAWFYRIATHVCLDELSRRRKRHLPQEVRPAVRDPQSEIAPNEPEAWVEPCPDAWLSDVRSSPEARYQQRESIALAFVAALQQLTPGQRANMLLRDVVGLSADETASALEMSVEAANSALHRARAALDARADVRDSPELPTPATLELLARYLRAWNERDLDAFVSLLHDEVRTTMPPSPTWISGRAHHIAFYRPMFEAQRPGWFFAQPTAANGQPAFAFYRLLVPGESYKLRAVQLVGVRARAIASIDHFVLPELAGVFGLPLELERF